MHVSILQPPRFVRLQPVCIKRNLLRPFGKNISSGPERNWVCSVQGTHTRARKQFDVVSRRTSLLGLKGVHDIWCAHLDGGSLIIGNF